MKVQHSCQRDSPTLYPVVTPLLLYIYLVSCMHLFYVKIPYISDCIIDKFPNCFLGPKSGYLEQVLLQRSLHKCLFSKHPRYRQNQCYTCQVFQGFGLFVQFPLRFNNNKPNPLSALSSCEHWRYWNSSVGISYATENRILVPNLLFFSGAWNRFRKENMEIWKWE